MRCRFQRHGKKIAFDSLLVCLDVSHSNFLIYFFLYFLSLKKIDVGNNVMVKRAQFFENIDTHSIDVQQMARNMSCMLWTREERTVRSLEGNPSHRFGTPGKLAATPSKISAVLGKSLLQLSKLMSLMSYLFIVHYTVIF